MEPKQDRRIDIALIFTALLSAFLNIYNIWKDLYANPYYTAAVTSMLQSFHNFFFASFDPGGYITIDKPPVTFWVQTLFARIFGVHGWSVILPQALAGVGSVLLIYYLVKPTFGKTAARLASLVMACTPVAVAVSRTNNIDSLLVFTLLLATWMLLKAVREQKISWMLGSFAMIGVGFNIKMLQAYMVLPAFYLFYLLAFNSPWKKKLAALAAATIILVGISLSWAVIVDSIPANNRPYIGGSQTNSVLELAFGYNGVSRLTGNRNMGGGDIKGGDMTKSSQIINRTNMYNYGGNTPPSMTPNGSRPEGFTPGNNGTRQMPGGNHSGGQGMGGMFNTGQAGPLRLFQSELSGQASWLLPLVLFGCIGLLAGIRRRKPLTTKENETLFWLAWLLPTMAFFSVAGFFHQYYLIMLAPPIAALAGAGGAELCSQYRTHEGWKRWLLPVAILATIVFELYILQPYQNQIGIGWLIGIGAAGIGLSMVLFLAFNKAKLASISAAAALLVLLAGPMYWAATPIIYGDNSSLPAAGPSQSGFSSRQGMSNVTKYGARPQTGGTEHQQQVDFGKNIRGDSRSNVNKKLIAYLTKNNTGEKYLFATTDANTAAPYIITTGKAVMAMGGFSGSDPAMTVAKLEKMVKNKEVKYFLISSGSGFRGGAGSSEVLNWIRSHSTEIPSSKWQSNSSSSGFGSMGMRDSMTLYEIKQ